MLFQPFKIYLQDQPKLVCLLYYNLLKFPTVSNTDLLMNTQPSFKYPSQLNHYLFNLFPNTIVSPLWGKAYLRRADTWSCVVSIHLCRRFIPSSKVEATTWDLAKSVHPILPAPENPNLINTSLSFNFLIPSPNERNARQEHRQTTYLCFDEHSGCGVSAEMVEELSID